ncbi:MAG TPA: acyltransferase [Thermoanaerobaculia bacterium]|nr:acyltransferase [Thermoanaerobaculia bacterium]
MSDAPFRLEYDWYGRGLPSNLRIGRDVYVDTAYGFAPFRSQRTPGLVLGDASGAYDRATFMVGPQGTVTVGEYTVLNGTCLVANDRITIGAHCLLAWGSVVTDTWIGAGSSPAARRALLQAAARDPGRHPGAVAPPRPVTLEDNVWLGFDSVVLPGVTLGRGAIVGCKTIVTADVAPYEVVVGDPLRVVRRLDADDTREARERALLECSRQ